MRRVGVKREERDEVQIVEDDKDPDDVQDFKRLRAVNPLSGKMFSDNYYALQRKRKELPVCHHKNEILKNVMSYPITLLVGETGSGKTTQIPQFLMEVNPTSKIICTQPRRVAAISVAMRVADELDVQIGDEVGYSVRFENRMSDKTRILYMTEGMLIKQLMSDSALNKCNILIIDEAHERTADTDVICGVAKGLITKRPDLRVLVMSATLDVDRMARFFNAPTLRVPGRMYPVDVYYSEGALQSYSQSAVDYAVNIHKREAPGDILVFLTGEAEIDKACWHCEDQIRALSRDESIADHLMNARVFPLYSRLAIGEQKQIFVKLPANTRKIIFSTNIAETSVTIDGIVYVVDSGFVKQTFFDVNSGVNSLVKTATSRSSADQRKGRAGRTRPGKCFRLYQEVQFSKFQEQNYPEIMRNELSDFVLTLLNLGVTNPVSFEYIDAPAPKAIMDALMRLSHLGAVDEELHLTEMGKKMGELPLDAPKARMLLMSGYHGCSNEIAAIAAVLSAGRVLSTPQRYAEKAKAAHEKFRDKSGDHLTYLRVFHEFVKNQSSAQFCFENFIQYRDMQQAHRIYMQLMQNLNKVGVPERSTYDPMTGAVNQMKVRRALLEGTFMNVAMLPKSGKEYITVRSGQPCNLPDECAIPDKPRWVMFDSFEFVETKGAHMKTVSIVDPRWLLEVSPQFFNPNEIEDPEIALALRNLVGGFSF